MNDLTLSYTSHIGIRWIVEEEVIPKNESTFFQHAKHFASDHFFHSHVKNRRKDCKLSNEIEAHIIERKPRSVDAMNLYPLWA